jgi:hypothetical protein
MRKAVKVVGIVATLGGIAAVTVIMMTDSCKQAAPEFAGVGKYRFGHTVLDHIGEGVCQPTTIDDGKRTATWCFALPAYKIANRAGEIELYFDGPPSQKDAPLIEIQVKIRGCLEQDLETWMRQSFGPPIETRNNRFYYKNSYLWAAALIPSDPGRCRVHLLPLSEQEQIAKVKAF